MRAIKNVLFNKEVDFSDWLGNNLHKLDSFVNSTLKIVGTEKPIDGKIIDILAEDQEGKTVVIENQFGVSDHKHLGQILSYCIGLKKEKKEVKNGVWIAEKFHPIHIAVLKWLNNTGSGIEFIPISVVNPETNQAEIQDKLVFKKPILYNEVQVGDILDALNHERVKIDDNLKKLMDEYDEEKGKTKPISKSVRNGQITGSFIYWIYKKNENLYKTFFTSNEKL